MEGKKVGVKKNKMERKVIEKRSDELERIVKEKGGIKSI